MTQEDLPSRLMARTSWFREARAEFVIASIVEGNTPGELWEIATEDVDPVLLLWDGGNNVLYFAGSPPQRANRASLEEVIGLVRKRALEAGKSWFKARTVPDALMQDLPGIFPFPLTRRTTTLRFTSGRHVGVSTPNLEPASCEIVPIDGALLDGQLERLQDVRNEMRSMWGSVALFRDRGFGFAAVKDREVICWCTAEYMSATMCGIGIESVEQYQNRGIATAVAHEFLQEAARRGVKPYWECHSRNVPSIRVAGKLGLEQAGSEEYWLGDFG